jgi:hypothetical protein
VLPKLRVGGCLAAHNVYPGRGRQRGMTGDFHEFMTSQTNRVGLFGASSLSVQ